MGDLLQPTHLLILGFIFTFFFLIPKFFYILTLSNALNKCHPMVRKIDPGMCWLYIVPIVGIIWHFFMVAAVADTLGAEFYRRGTPSPDPRPAYSLGLACCICGACSIIPLINILAMPVQLVLWIMYWAKVSEYSRHLDYMQPIVTFQGQ
jgi:hypothetical protein